METEGKRSRKVLMELLNQSRKIRSCSVQVCQEHRRTVSLKRADENHGISSEEKNLHFGLFSDRVRLVTSHISSLSTAHELLIIT